jgi:hypothetical protein
MEWIWTLLAWFEFEVTTNQTGFPPPPPTK